LFSLTLASAQQHIVLTFSTAETRRIGADQDSSTWQHSVVDILFTTDIEGVTDVNVIACWRQ
jgi:hypothetical protein